jgi:hypothetical protein
MVTDYCGKKHTEKGQALANGISLPTHQNGSNLVQPWEEMKTKFTHACVYEYSQFDILKKSTWISHNLDNPYMDYREYIVVIASKCFSSLKIFAISSNINKI